MTPCFTGRACDLPCTFDILAVGIGERYATVRVCIKFHIHMFLAPRSSTPHSCFRSNNQSGRCHHGVEVRLHAHDRSGHARVRVGDGADAFRQAHMVRSSHASVSWPIILRY